MNYSILPGTTGLLCALAFAGAVSAQSGPQHRVHQYELGANTDKASKSQTMDPAFSASAPLGLPRNAVPFQIDYDIAFVVDNATENIDYFAFHAPSGWTITAIGTAPPFSATECQDVVHTSVVSGFSATSAYWGGDYDGGAGVTPGTPATYPDINNRSGCGPFDTATDSATAVGAGLSHVFSVTMTPSAPDDCPGSTTGALPLCCSAGEVQAGGDPPVGSEPYFNEMIAASDTNATVFGDGFYYVSLECLGPQISLAKFPLDATINSSDCAAAFPAPDTLTIPAPPAEPAQFCYRVLNFSNIFTDTWNRTACDSVRVSDNVLGTIFAQSITLNPGSAGFFASADSVNAPPVDECAQNTGQASCTTGEGSTYIPGQGIQPNISFTGNAVPNNAWLCTVSSLPVELTHFGVKVENRDLLLEWTTASETNNSGFSIEHRLADETAFREVGFVEGAGTTRNIQTYAFRVTDPGPGRHAVRLKQIDFDGALTFSSVLLTEIEVPGEYYLTAAYPNPFTATAKVEFAVPKAQDVVIELVDVQGRTVQTVFDGRLDANARRTALIDASGLASGTYFLRMNGDGFRASETVTIAR